MEGGRGWRERGTEGGEGKVWLVREQTWCDCYSEFLKNDIVGNVITRVLLMMIEKHLFAPLGYDE